MRTYLIFDVNYLTHRNFYSIGGLDYRDMAAGVLFGMLRDIRSFTKRFDTDNIVFCFDHGKSKRAELFPSYKANRLKANTDPMLARAIGDMKLEVEKLKFDYLPNLGYKCVFYQDGYEADDLIAMVVNNLGGKEQAVVVSKDGDLLQLLRPGVQIYHPGKDGGALINEGQFRAQWRISPSEWWRVKAVAGCDSDNIPGIKGVGEITAARWVAGVAPTTAHGRVLEAQMNEFKMKSEYRRNVRLVRLPFEGTEKFRATTHPAITADAWSELCEKNGIKSLNRSIADTFASVEPKRPT